MVPLLFSADVTDLAVSNTNTFGIDVTESSFPKKFQIT